MHPKHALYQIELHPEVGFFSCLLPVVSSRLAAVHPLWGSGKQNGSKRIPTDDEPPTHSRLSLIFVRVDLLDIMTDSFR